MNQNHDPAIDTFIQDVVNFGSHYQMEDMERLYTGDQSILFVSGDGTVARVPRADMMAEFHARGAANNPPLSTEHKILHVEQQGDHATAILYRRMSPSNPPAMYELRMRKEDGRWMVAGETVTAWPRAEDAEDFLPPRQN
ncbi:hypothetical protein [Sphingobium sp.]|uniref:hypothetical protein n=1 Tax=Sphingobium sp. TaxID=1912891 RepID=UPI003B3BDA74